MFLCQPVPLHILFYVFFFKFLYYFELIYCQCPYSHVYTYRFGCVYLIKINQSVQQRPLSYYRVFVTTCAEERKKQTAHYKLLPADSCELTLPYSCSLKTTLATSFFLFSTRCSTACDVSFYASPFNAETFTINQREFLQHVRRENVVE